MAAPPISAEHPPQILPWLARKAAMPLDRAKAVWRLALRNAARSGVRPNSSEYWQQAIEGLLESVNAETDALQTAPFGFGPLLRLPAKLWLLGLTGGEAVTVATTRRWRTTVWWWRTTAH